MGCTYCTRPKGGADQSKAVSLLNLGPAEAQKRRDEAPPKGPTRSRSKAKEPRPAKKQQKRRGEAARQAKARQSRPTRKPGQKAQREKQSC